MGDPWNDERDSAFNADAGPATNAFAKAPAVTNLMTIAPPAASPRRPASLS
jgi:hypothetical protein